MEHVAWPVVSWASMPCRFHLKANFAGRECRQEARAALGRRQAASGEAEPFEFTVTSKDGHRSLLPAREPLAALTRSGCLRLEAPAPQATWWVEMGSRSGLQVA